MTDIIDRLSETQDKFKNRKYFVEYGPQISSLLRDAISEIERLRRTAGETGVVLHGQ